MNEDANVNKSGRKDNGKKGNNHMCRNEDKNDNKNERTLGMKIGTTIILSIMDTEVSTRIDRPFCTLELTSGFCFVRNMINLIRSEEIRFIAAQTRSQTVWLLSWSCSACEQPGAGRCTC